MSDIHDIEVKICCIKLTLAARVIAMIGLVSKLKSSNDSRLLHYAFYIAFCVYFWFLETALFLEVSEGTLLEIMK